MQGTPLPIVACHLGHNNSTMTLRYAHTGSHETGEVISGLLGMSSII